MKSELVTMLINLQTYVMDNDEIDEDVMFVIVSKINQIKDKLLEDK